MIGRTLSHYRILERVGSGGMGEVYRARDQRLERDVALKILPAATAADLPARRRLRKEALALSKLNHPGIAAVHDFDSHEDIAFLVMEFVPGGTLAEEISGGPIEEKDVIDIAIQVAEALKEAHDHGIIHRDLKPGNIMVTPRHRVKVLDFGLAKSVDPISEDSTTQTISGLEGVAGTLPYMAPEQLSQELIDARTDLYALGAVMYEMATGRRPFAERHPATLAGAILHRDPESPRSLNPSLSERLAVIVLKALQKNPGARHQSADELLAELLGEVETAGPLHAAGQAIGNLPHPQSTFVGRQRELAEIRRSLSATRLLTLTGSGGCGKTRMAVAAAAVLREDYPDGVWMVEFAAVTDPGLTRQTVAEALGLREQPGRELLETMTEWLRPKRLLLLLDNCEHLLESIASLTKDLLSACPRLRALATSREGLGVPEEQARRIPSLSLPPLASGRGGEVAQAIRSEAVHLFVDRARALAPAFRLSDENVAAVVQICRRLDGIPLALELAAARIQLLLPEEIAARLDDRFRLLTGGPRGAIPRQQTLHALIDWSHNLLSPPEQTLFRRLSVFAGGWSVRSAEAVCSDQPTAVGIATIASYNILDLMTSLVQKSLVLVDENETEVRCGFLETVRQYGSERLAVSREASTVLARHRDYYLSFAEQLPTSDLTKWLSDREREHDNLRVAMDLCSGPGEEATIGLRIAVGLGLFWSVRGHLSEGRCRLTHFLESADVAMPVLRTEALNWIGKLGAFEGRYEEAASCYEQALGLSKGLGDRHGIAKALCGLGLVNIFMGNYGAARTVLEESLLIQRELGNRLEVATVLNNLGIVASNVTQRPRAISLFREALEISRELKDKWGIASRLGNLAMQVMMDGRPDEAAVMHQESLALWAELGDRRSIAEGLAMYGETLYAQGQMERSARLFAAADALREAIGRARPPVDQDSITEAVQGIRQALGEQEFIRVWREGMALGQDEALAYALGNPP